jgi:DNA-binding MarR family transcriptional regulator
MVKHHRLVRPAAPKPGEGKRGTSGYFAYLLRQASATLRTTLDRALADLDITTPQFSALLMLGSYPDLSSAELARVSLLTPQTVNLIVRNLEVRGALARHPHPIHGRILVLQITPEGKRLLAECRKRADAIEARLSAGLMNEAEKEVVRRWLVFVATQLHAPSNDDQV